MTYFEGDTTASAQKIIFIFYTIKSKSTEHAVL